MIQARNGKWRVCLLGYGVLVAGMMLAGCATIQTLPPENPTEWPEPLGSKILLQPGDAIQVRFQEFPELEDEQVIRPDGNINLRLVGVVPAADRTPEQLEKELEVAYADKTIDPEINVVVGTFSSRLVYVTGEVLVPGVIAMNADMTMLDAIMRAGGFIKWSARRDSVILIRQRPGKCYARRFNLRKAFEDPTFEQFYLEPYDIVFVPRTRIEQVDQWVDQYIDQTLGPRSFHGNFNLNKSLDDYYDEQTMRSYQFVAPTK
ncbi:MAG TPA: polysaccharide biosynthesis/export family protein [Candidatus Hydrogenedentes bacterium]|nr:polysaccharide biosynthesis/export family protein [Candidatus Hydrogenedentota bacterium]HPG67286.1 polysaccharide biosynthesis/export family protein [Candidatus Hydrogenedentota bacterium]